MNKNQRLLYNALATIANSTMTLEDAVGVVEKLNEEQIQQVVDQFEAKYTEFSENDLGDDAYNYLGNAEVVLRDVARKLNSKE